MKPESFEAKVSDAAVAALEAMDGRGLTNGAVKIALILATDLVDLNLFGAGFDGDSLRALCTEERVRFFLARHTQRDEEGGNGNKQGEYADYVIR